MIKRLTVYLTVSLLLLSLVVVAAQAQQENSAPALGAKPGQQKSNYQLGAGDLISIDVFGEDILSLKEVRLTDGGTFSFPFLGEVRAKGRTSSEIEAIIAQGLRGDYLLDPKVTVRILEYRPFFVNGEVKNPGGYPFKPGLTLRKVIALAGGFTERASRNRVYVIRDSDPSRKSIRLTLESPVFPGDIVTVDQSFF